MSAIPLTDEEWERLCAYRDIAASGESLDAIAAIDCDALAVRIKIPRPKVLPKPGTPLPTTPIAEQPPDSMTIV